LVLKRL